MQLMLMKWRVLWSRGIVRNMRMPTIYIEENKWSWKIGTDMNMSDGGEA